MSKLSRWMTKKGTLGGAARLMIKAYRKQKSSHPNASDREIFEAITKWRYSITGEELDAETFNTIVQSESVRDFVKNIVIIERMKDIAHIKSDTTLFATLREIHEVIDEICDESGIP